MRIILKILFNFDIRPATAKSGRIHNSKTKKKKDVALNNSEEIPEMNTRWQHLSAQAVNFV